MTLFTAIKKMAAPDAGKTEEKTVQPVKTKEKTVPRDKKQIEAATARANRTGQKRKIGKEVPYERMWPRTRSAAYGQPLHKDHPVRTSTISFSQNEDKTAIFEGCMCDFPQLFRQLNSLPAVFFGSLCGIRTFANSISIPPQRDAFKQHKE